MKISSRYDSICGTLHSHKKCSCSDPESSTALEEEEEEDDDDDVVVVVVVTVADVSAVRPTTGIDPNISLQVLRVSDK